MIVFPAPQPFVLWYSSVQKIVLPTLLFVLMLSFVHAESAFAELYRYTVSGIMPIYGDVPGDFKVSPDSKYVVYIADQETDGAYELFSAPIDASAPPTRISPLLPTTVEITSFSISPDSSRVIYRADQQTDEVYELFGVYDDSYKKSLLLLFMPAIISSGAP